MYSIKTRGLAFSTVKMALAVISKEHVLAGLFSPMQAYPLSRLALDAARRRSKKPAKRYPLKKAELTKMWEVASTEPGFDRDFTAVRDLAMMFVGFAMLLRPAEIVSLRYEDLTWDEKADAYTLNIRKSKVDQMAEGTTLPINAMARQALRHYLWVRGIAPGYLFHQKPQKKALQVGAVPVEERPISPATVNHIVKRWAGMIGLDVEGLRVGGYSLRRGGDTALAKAGTDIFAMRRLGRWAPGSEMPFRYEGMEAADLVQAADAAFAEAVAEEEGGDEE
jgi:integrase